MEEVQSVVMIVIISLTRRSLEELENGQLFYYASCAEAVYLPVQSYLARLALCPER